MHQILEQAHTFRTIVANNLLLCVHSLHRKDPSEFSQIVPEDKTHKGLSIHKS